MRTEAVQLRLLTWFSPAFPIGAFGYSHGLETAIRQGPVGNADALRTWIEGLLEHGSGWTDALLFKLAWAAADAAELAELAELAEALAPSLERHRETMQLGAAFLRAVRPWIAAQDPPPLGEVAHPAALRRGDAKVAGSQRDPGGAGGGFRSDRDAAHPDLLSGSPLTAFGGAPPSGEHLVAPYPVAAGWACAAAGVPLPSALTAWLHGFAANLVSVAVRAIPIGQSDAVSVLAALEPAILAAAERAADAGDDDLGSCAFLSDIAAMRHETLQPRLFIS